jgi:hypothetical protein
MYAAEDGRMFKDVILRGSRNLSDVPDKAKARANLGISDSGGSGTGVAVDEISLVFNTMGKLEVALLDCGVLP